MILYFSVDYKLLITCSVYSLYTQIKFNWVDCILYPENIFWLRWYFAVLIKPLLPFLYIRFPLVPIRSEHSWNLRPVSPPCVVPLPVLSEISSTLTVLTLPLKSKPLLTFCLCLSAPAPHFWLPARHFCWDFLSHQITWLKKKSSKSFLKASIFCVFFSVSWRSNIILAVTYYWKFDIIGISLFPSISPILNKSPRKFNSLGLSLSIILSTTSTPYLLLGFYHHSSGSGHLPHLAAGYLFFLSVFCHYCNPPFCCWQGDLPAWYTLVLWSPLNTNMVHTL